MRVMLVSAVLVLGGLSLPAQQRAPAVQAPSAGQATFDTRETRDPAQTQDEEFAKLGQGVDDAAVLHQPAGRSPAEGAGHSVAEGRARLPHRRAGEADLLRRHPEVLPRARGGDAAREGRDDRQVRRGSRAGRRLGLVGREHQEPAAEPRQPREDRRSARPDAGSDQAAASRRPSRTTT